MALRFPRLVPVFARTIWSLPFRSRLRHWLIRLAVRNLFEAINRGDYEAALLLYHPEGVTTLPWQLAGLGSDSRTVGRQGRLRFQQKWTAEWGEFRVEPQEIISTSDNRMVVLVQVEGTGLSSGAAASAEGAFVFDISAGRAVREQVFLRHAEALEAAGLSE